jgi:hypothetical protein
MTEFDRCKAVTSRSATISAMISRALGMRIRSLILNADESATGTFIPGRRREAISVRHDQRLARRLERRKDAPRARCTVYEKKALNTAEPVAHASAAKM